jgi:hypothetical protein
VFVVRVLVLEQPDVENVLRVVREEVLLQFFYRPFDRAAGAFLDDIRWLVADNNERTLDDDREVLRWQSLF